MAFPVAPFPLSGSARGPLLTRLRPWTVDLDYAGKAIDANAYTGLRIRLGLSEGWRDHPPVSARPVECNLDYLNGSAWWRRVALVVEEMGAGPSGCRLMPLMLIHSMFSSGHVQ